MGQDSIAPDADPATSSSRLEAARDIVAAGRRADLRTTGRSFWSDVAWSFVFINQPSNAITFVFVWLLYVAAESCSVVTGFSPLLSRFGCLALVFWLALTGWIYSFLLNCIVDVACGEDDLPTLRFTEGLLDDMVYPLFKFVGAWFVVLLPALIYTMVALGCAPAQLRADIRAAGSAGELFDVLGPWAPPLVALAGLAVFFWPITVLVVAMSRLADVFRIDLILRTVGRTFLPYLATCLLVGVAFGLEVGALRALSRPAGGGTTGANVALIVVLANGAIAYFDVVAMRIIGLYYRHFSNRFAWSWE
jgi:hypothetical protein